MKVGQQGPDVYFQGRETSNLQYQNAPAIIQQIMDEVGAKLGRNYKLFDYVGHPEAEDVIVAMGSGCETVQETIEYLNKERGMKLGLVKVRVYRPFSVDAFRAAVPQSVKRIAVLDRTKEPGSIGEPLYLDVVSALKDRCDLSIIGGRYGLFQQGIHSLNGACHLQASGSWWLPWLYRGHRRRRQQAISTPG